MIDNDVIKILMARKSIRKYTTEMPEDEVIKTVVAAGQQAPFAFQMGSVLLSKGGAKNPFNAPLLFTICVDSYRMERVMAERGWSMATNDLSLLMFGIQDAALMAQNMVIAAESLGLGSCFIGNAPYRSKEIKAEYGLPERVFPLVQLVMGYPAENPPTRPRYPINFSLFENTYPQFTSEDVRNAMRIMDEGYLAQNYYRRAKYMIPLEGDKAEKYTFRDYSWTEHICRKVGQWLKSPEDILAQLEHCGFSVGVGRKEKGG